MGNKLGRKKQAVDDKYTRPQGLYQHRDIDHKKLRKLILDSKLAPCYPGEDDRSSAPELEECPICFLYYPSLNRSRCCTKSICTECFLQMKPPHSMRPTQCPFCKTCNYAVEYRGEKSKEEKGKEQIEEQKVIEAKIRIQQQELQEEEERKLHKKEATCSASQVMMPVDVECRDMPVPSHKCETLGYQPEPSHNSRAYLSSRQTPNSRHNREDEFDLDLEDLMVMEAIWLSIQDHGNNGSVNTGAFPSSASSSLVEHSASPALVPPESSSSTGLVCAAAALAEHQHFSEGSMALSGTSSFNYGALPRMGCIPTGERSVGHYAPDNWVGVPSDRQRMVQVGETEWATGLRPMGIRSDVVEVNSYADSSGTMDAETGLHIPDGPDMPSGHLIPETFEEQMMLAMAVSLAEARSRTNTQGVTWM